MSAPQIYDSDSAAGDPGKGSPTAEFTEIEVFEIG